MMYIQNNFSILQQAIVLKEDLPGFIFESNRGTKHSFTAETSLGPDFAASWAGKKNKKFKSKMEAIKQRVTANNIHSNRIFCHHNNFCYRCKYLWLNNGCVILFSGERISTRYLRSVFCDCPGNTSRCSG